MNKRRIMYAVLIGNLIKKAVLNCVFRTMGYKNREWISFCSVKAAGEEKRRKWLDKLEEKFSKI